MSEAKSDSYEVDGGLSDRSWSSNGSTPDLYIARAAAKQQKALAAAPRLSVDLGQWVP